MKTYLLTNIIMLMAISQDHPEWNVTPIATNLRYETGDMVIVADRRFIDSLRIDDSVNHLPVVTLPANQPVAYTGIMILQANIDSNQIIK